MVANTASLFQKYVLGHGFQESLEGVVESGGNGGRPRLHRNEPTVSLVHNFARFVSLLHLLEHSRNHLRKRERKWIQLKESEGYTEYDIQTWIRLLISKSTTSGLKVSRFLSRKPSALYQTYTSFMEQHTVSKEFSFKE